MSSAVRNNTRPEPGPIEGRWRVVHVVPYFTPDGHGGVQSHVSGLAREMGGRHDVLVLAFTEWALPGGRRPEQRDSFRVSWLSKPGNTSGRPDDRWPELERDFEEAVRELQPDVIHLHQLAGLSTELVGASKQVARVVVVTLHDYLSLCPTDTIDGSGRLCFDSGRRCYSCLYPDAFSRRRDLGLWRVTNPMLTLVGGVTGSLTQAGRRLAALDARKQRHFDALARADRLIAPSRALAKVFADSGLQAEMAVISHGVEPSPGSSARTTGGGRMRFGFIGSHRVKGLELLLRAFRSIDEDAAELWVHSNLPSYSRRLRARLCRLAARDNIHLMGSFDPEDADEVFGRFDVLVAPSVWVEPFGLVAAEARARGMPVIAADTCGLEETVTDGVNGVLFERGNEAALARALRRFVLEPALLSRLGSGSGTVKGIAEQAIEIEQVYAECLQGRGDRCATPRLGA